MTRHTLTRTTLITLLIALTGAMATATPTIEGVSTDPAFITAGDTVDLSVNLYDHQYTERDWDAGERPVLRLEPGNRLTREYVEIVSDRDPTPGFLYPEGAWNQQYRFDLAADAPEGDYSFELHISYEDRDQDSIDASNISLVREFTVPVEGEGTDLFLHTEETAPTRPQPGDDGVTATLAVTNTGEQRIEELVLEPRPQTGIELARSEGQRRYIGPVSAGETIRDQVRFDLAEDLGAGLYPVPVTATYEDTDDRQYTKELTLPLRVEGRPYLTVTQASTPEIPAGETGTVRFTVQNEGSEEAEATTVRLVLDASQPLTAVDRSVFLGTIAPGSERTGTVTVQATGGVNRTHGIDLLVRASGDRDTADVGVHTFDRIIDVGVTEAPFPLLTVIGGVVAVLAIIGLVVRRRWDR